MAGSVKWLRANEERAAEEERGGRSKRRERTRALDEERLGEGSRGTGMKSMLV